MDQLLKNRTSLRTKATKISKSIEEARLQEHTDEDDLAFLLFNGENLIREMNQVQDELDSFEVYDDSKHLELLTEQLFKGNRLLKRLEAMPTTTTRLERVPSMTADPTVSNITIPKFNGNLMAWAEFNEIFDSFVHSNIRYSDVQKFVILKTHLGGEASQAIEGVPYTAEGYILARSILNERYNQSDKRREVIIGQIMDIPAVADDHNLKALRSLVDKIAACIRSLESLDIPSSSLSSIITPVIKSKLPDAWRLGWVRNVHETTGDLPNLLKYLQREIALREDAASPIRSFASPSRILPPRQQPAAASALRVSTRPSNGSTWTCVACGRYKHGLSRCYAYQNMSVQERWAAVRYAGLCFQCLGPHQYRSCKSTPCPRCGAPHHSSLHGTELSHGSSHPQSRTTAAPSSDKLQLTSDQPQPTSFQNPTLASPATSDHHDTGGLVNKEPVHHHYNAAAHGRCFMMTALIEVTGPAGAQLARALIDGGSDSSFVKSSLADALGLSVTAQGIFACVGFKEREEEARIHERVRLQLTSRHSSESCYLDFWKSDKLCAPMRAPCSPDLFTELASFELADDFSGSSIDILIGADQMYDVVLPDNTVKLSKRLCAVKTLFGYTLHGSASDAGRLVPLHTYHLQSLENMWTLDTIGITDKEVRSTSGDIVPVWNSSENRYEMPLLWKTDERPVSNLRATNMRTSRTMQKMNPQALTDYNIEIKQLIDNRVVEVVDTVTETNSVFFLPHRGIYRNGKLRIVFDGSAADGSGKSLNEYFDAGENLLHRLPAVVTQFRTGTIGCQADIKSAFHQICVRKEDQQYLQFLWKGNVFRFRRVPFGLACSPFLLLKTLSYHLEQSLKNDQGLLQAVKRALYMDDLCLSFSSEEEADKNMNVLNAVIEQAGMKLHKIHRTGDNAEPSKVLGMLWDTSSDKLAVTVPDVTTPTTRRELISVISKVFDPLGVLSPWVIRGKILFQSTWHEAKSTSWDDRLSSDVQKAVNVWWSHPSSWKMWFPRAIADLMTSTDVRFHVFCDASIKAYCAAVYCCHGGESILVIAKSRLAPLSPTLTIPRLELMAALIGARLMKFVCSAIGLEAPCVVYWTDSMDVLYWIRQTKPQKPFVENRVREICQLSSVDQWQYIEGVRNPADLGTRGITLMKLSVSRDWWNGPSVLLEALSQPTLSVPFLSAEGLVELRRDCDGMSPETKACAYTRQISHTHQFVGSQREHLFDLDGCATLKQAVHRMAWIMRFCHNARRPPAERWSGALTPDERKTSLYELIRTTQELAYRSDTAPKQNGSTLLTVDSTLDKMRPQLNTDGLLCAVSRTNEPPIIVLPEQSRLTTLIIEEAHRLCFHQGVRVTLAQVSVDYLVRRRTVKKVVDSCRRCRRFKGLPYRSAEGALPAFRTVFSRPFAKIGIDYFGPMYIDSGSKVWILLFTCATSRAVHLELVSSQDAQNLMQALRRFFALRGTPSVIISDNAKSFRMLQGLVPRAVSWRFIPEAAPWWGGFWERMVGVTKRALRVTLHQCHLSFIELSTTLYELSYHLNLRPLTAERNLEALTPAHFLFGVQDIRGVISPAVTGNDTGNISRAWRHQQRVARRLVNRWNTEYLQTLRAWNTPTRTPPPRLPRKGDVVLVSDKVPRGRWPLARVLDLFPGRDGHYRAAMLEMRGKQTRRPISKLYALEAAGQQEKADADDE